MGGVVIRAISASRRCLPRTGYRESGQAMRVRPGWNTSQILVNMMPIAFHARSPNGAWMTLLRYPGRSPPNLAMRCCRAGLIPAKGWLSAVFLHFLEQLRGLSVQNNFHEYRWTA